MFCCLVEVFVIHYASSSQRESYILKNVIHSTNPHAIMIRKRVGREDRKGLLSIGKYLLLSGFAETGNQQELST